MIGAVSALVAAVLAVSLRPILRPGVLTASSKQGGPLFGASASTRSWLARSTAEFGHLPIVSSTYRGLPAKDVWTTGAAGFNKSAAVVSFTAPPRKVLSGVYDAALSDFFKTAPSGRTIYYSYDSEPETSIRTHRFRLSRYKAAWAHIVALAHKAHNAGLKSTLILNAADLTAGSGQKWKKYLPAGKVITTLGWNAYPAGTMPDHDPKLTKPANFIGPAVAASKSVGLPFGIAGFALATANGRATWLKEVANYLMASGALFGVLTNSPKLPLELTDAASIAAWRMIVSRSGTDDPLPIGPAPTTSPPPTTSPTPQPTTASPSPQPTVSIPPGSAAGTPVCGQPILNSPFSYDGAAGSYSSGTAGLPTYGTPGSDFPNDTAGDVISAGTADFASYQLNPDTVYYLLPGTHIGSFQADTNDAFVGGLSNGTSTILSGNYSSNEPWAIASNDTDGNQTGVTIEYLTIEKYTPGGNAAAINQDTNTGWTMRYNTVTLNVPGAGIFAGSENTITDNCLTLNGQYGFQSALADSWGADSLTGGPYDITVSGNEISYNDTCDYEGLLDNSAIGWSNYNPVPAADRNAKCGTVVPDGDEGGFKLWQTDGITIEDNYIHNNWGPGAWVDTDNANTTITGNTITNNEGEAIIEEVSYNFGITNNYMADNNWIDGLSNPEFPAGAVYISESGSDTTVGAVPACPETSCADQPSYPTQSVVSGNTLVDNGGSIFLWQNSNRYCSDGSDGVCTLVDGGSSSPFTISSCAKNLPTASLNTTTFVGNKTGSPAEDWWDGCMWQTANVSITGNVIDFNPANILDCNQTDWPACGSGGIFSEYGSPPNNGPGWVVPTELTFFQNDVWADNTYNGPSTFYAWNQGNGDNPVSWADWSGGITANGGDKCSSSGERQSGFCTGPFGQDAGSTYNSTPVATNP